MNEIAQELRKTGGRLTGNPAAVFVAVLTAGMAVTSYCTHPGIAHAGPQSSISAPGKRAAAVPACKRSRSAPGAEPAPVARPASQLADRASAPAAAPSPAVPREGGGSAERREVGRHPAGGANRDFTFALPDFSAPELSRFTSPL